MKKCDPAPLNKVQYEAINYETLYATFKNDTTTNNTRSYTILEEKLLNIIKQSVITIEKILNLPRRDWINREIIKEINARNILWRQYKENPKSDSLKESFTKKRNYVTKIIKQTKGNYFCKAFKNCKNKPAKMWSLINTLSNNKAKAAKFPDKLKNKDGRTVDKENEVCEVFNEYFASVGLTLAQKIIKPNVNYNHDNIEASGSIRRKRLDHLSPATTFLKIIENLNPNTSSGLHGITSKALIPSLAISFLPTYMRVFKKN